MSRIKLLIALFSLLVWTNPVFADGVASPAANESSLTITEIDGAPTVTVNRLKVTNGTLTDNGDGTATVASGGTGAPTTATYLTQTADGGLSAEQALGSLATGCLGVTTTTGVVASRTITGTANQISVANGDCSGAPILSIPTNPTLPGNVTVTGILTTGSGTTTTGSVTVNGVTSGSLALTTAAATAQAITVTGAAQTTGATTLTIPDQGGTSRNFVFDTLTQTLTNKSIDCGTGNTCTIKREYYDEVAGCNGVTAGPIWNLPTTNAATPTCDTGTNQFSAFLAFADAANQSTHRSFRLPTGYSGGIDWLFRYKMDAGTTGTIGWCVQLVRLPTLAAGDPAFPALAAGNCVSSTVPGTAGYEGEASITNVTCTSCVAGDRVFVRVSRDGNGTAVIDSATGVGRLIFTGPAYAVAY